MTSGRERPIILVILGAVLFGASAPVSKLLLGEADPVMLAGLLYLGCGLGLLAFRFFLRAAGTAGGKPLGRGDAPWLAGAVLAGGVAAPIALLLGLRSTPAATASLLLNFECVATALLAALLFHEYIGRRVWLAIGLVTAASAMLSFSGPLGASAGALAVLAACVLWGVDNNLTRLISSKDAMGIGIVKGLGAGTFSLLLALGLGASLPPPSAIAAALLLGCLSYGLSLALYITGMRSIGAARASAWMGTAPFAGVLLSLLIFGVEPGWAFILALPPMALGIALLAGDDHAHTHIHAHGAVTHDHVHVHDDGHGHKHK